MSTLSIFITTFHRHEALIDSCIEVLQGFWPRHPPIVVVSDQGRFRYPSKIITSSSNWLAMVKEALDQHDGDDEDFILLLLEDHIPLSPIPYTHLETALQYAQDHSLDYLGLYGHGIGELQSEPHDGLQIYHRLPSYQFYSEVHPAIWKISYLKQLLQNAEMKGIDSIWEFEKFRSHSIHYTTNKLWTSKLGGFLHNGYVSLEYIRQFKSPKLKKLKRKLYGKFLSEMPQRLIKKLQPTYGS